MKRHPAISAINIIGLVLGIVTTTLVLGYVLYERSYDSYHEKGDDVYRIVYDHYRGEELLWKTAGSCYPSSISLKEKYPEVVDQFNLKRNFNVEISVTDQNQTKKSFFEEKTYFASAGILRMLHIPLVSGSISCLDQPNTVIISERIAEKYFKNTDPLGQTLKVSNRDEYTITGVFKTLPKNTHIKSDLFFSFSTILSKLPWVTTNWSFDLLHSYIQLKPGTDYKEFEKRAFPQMIADNYASRLAVNSERDEYALQPIKDIHLHSNIESETEPPGNGMGINILLGFAIFLLCIAWINYINLVTARAIERAKEVAVKKVCGCSKKMLIRQFITETFLFNFICIAISTGVILLLKPLYHNLTGIADFHAIFNPRFCILITLVMLGGIFLSSLYPAFVLSSFREIEVLKGNFKNSRQGVVLRKALVTFQLFLSLVLLIGTGVVYKQVKYLTSKDVGYDYHSTLVVKAPQTNEESPLFVNKLELLKERLLTNKNIDNFTVVSDIPGKEIDSYLSCYVKGEDPKSINGYYRTDVDPEYVPFFKTKLLAGRNFIESDRQAGNKMIVNLKAMERLGFADPNDAIGKMVMKSPKHEYEIIGVMGDMNYFSVKAEPMPTIFTAWDGAKRYLALKFNASADLHPIIADVEQNFKSIFPNNAFEYYLLEEKVAETTKTDRTFALIFSIASLLAIVISVIGIMGLIIISINQNLKSLGVRKVLGANLQTTYLFLWRLFYKQFILASFIALPVAYYGFTHWVLEKYVYHVSISLIQLIVPVLIILVVLLLVIFVFAKKAFSIKVVNVLKMD